jgi:hypothetical protein
MKLELLVFEYKEGHDSDDCTWVGKDKDGDKELRGGGFIPVGGERKGIIHIVRCPECLRENYMSQTVCINCGFTPDEKSRLEAARAVNPPQVQNLKGRLK